MKLRYYVARGARGLTLGLFIVQSHSLRFAFHTLLHPHPNAFATGELSYEIPWALGFIMSIHLYSRLLSVPWTARRLHQSILKEINPKYSLQGLTLATWWEEPTHLKSPWCWERLREGGEGMTDEMVGWHHWLNGHECEQTLGAVKDREAWHATVHGVTKVRHDWVTRQQWDKKWDVYSYLLKKCNLSEKKSKQKNPLDFQFSLPWQFHTLL